MVSPHIAAASVTRETKAIAVVESESSFVRVFDGGDVVADILPELWLWHRYSLHLPAPYTEREGAEVTVVTKRE